MSTNTTTTEMTLVKTLAPEDICRGNYVTILTKVCEYPSYFWNGSSQYIEASDVVSIRYRPPETGEPMKVIDICLPFLFVKPLKGKPQTLDVRACQLAKMSDRYVKNVRKSINKKASNK